MADLLAANGVDTCEDLHAWLPYEPNRAALRGVRGVGPKTVDYIGNLVGHSGVAVDAHLRAFAAEAGLSGLGYERLRAVYEATAVALGHESGGLEHAIWQFKSQGRRGPNGPARSTSPAPRGPESDAPVPGQKG